MSTSSRSTLFANQLCPSLVLKELLRSRPSNSADFSPVIPIEDLSHGIFFITIVLVWCHTTESEYIVCLGHNIAAIIYILTSVS